MKNFSDAVAQPVQDKIETLAPMLAEFISNMSGDTFGDDPTIEPIEWKSRDGFISWNNGGLSVSQSFYCGNGSGIYHTTKEREFCEQQANNCAWQYCMDHQIDFDTFDYLGDDFAEYKQEWFNDQYTIIEARAWVTRDDGKINLELLAHYRDCPYMRDKHAEEVLVKRYTPAEFLVLDDAAIVQLFDAAYKGA
jgi:hypothetical protein